MKIVLLNPFETLYTVDQFLILTEVGEPCVPYYLAREKYRNQTCLWKPLKNINDSLPPLEGLVSKYPYQCIRLYSDNIGSRGDDDTSISFNLDSYRTNEILIRAVENGKFSKLRVIEIPNGIEWYIDHLPCGYDEYYEIVREKHGIFGIID